MGAVAMDDRPSGSSRVPAGASVTVLRGFYEGLEIPIESDWFVIGRGKTADAILAEATISRAHVAVGWNESQGFFVEDLGSTNGTLVNGKKHDQRSVRDGDEIQIGKLRLRIRLQGVRS